jgi:hypothetical protein
MEPDPKDMMSRENALPLDPEKNTAFTDESDIADSPRDTERLQGDFAILDLPDVEDIPGQENIHVPPLGMLADTTISSADEEGDGLFDDDDDDEEL